MNTKKLKQLNWLDQIFWNISYKNRRKLVIILMLLIFMAATFVAQKFIAMEMQLKSLSKYEPIYVLALTRDLNPGDLIRAEDLRAMIFYKEEFQKITYRDLKTQLELPALIACKLDLGSGKLIGIDDIVTRVVTSPVYKGSLLRQENLAAKGTLPGLINLIRPGQALVDIAVPISGFNVHIKPNDQVDLYEIGAAHKLLMANARVILVDSRSSNLEKNLDKTNSRQLTLAVDDKVFAAISQAIKNKTLALTYHNQNLNQPKTNFRQSISKPKPLAPVLNPFQSLLLIKGAEKEIINQ